MACLREQALAGRRGVIPCDEEGCQFRCIEIGGGRVATGEASETHCLLQLRLRVGGTKNVETCTHDIVGIGLTSDREVFLWCTNCDETLPFVPFNEYDLDIDNNVWFRVRPPAVEPPTELKKEQLEERSGHPLTDYEWNWLVNRSRAELPPLAPRIMRDGKWLELVPIDVPPGAGEHVFLNGQWWGLPDSGVERPQTRTDPEF